MDFEYMKNCKCKTCKELLEASEFKKQNDEIVNLLYRKRMKEYMELENAGLIRNNPGLAEKMILRQIQRSYDYRVVRKKQFSQSHLCRLCHEPKTTHELVLHHKKYANSLVDINLIGDENNLILCCKKCHSRLHSLIRISKGYNELGYFEFGKNKYLIEDLMMLKPIPNHI